MPCLILTGHPCAGKTTVAKVLEQRALQHPSIHSVVLVNEEMVCPDSTKQSCYETAAREKQTRAALKSAFDRAVGDCLAQQEKQQKVSLIILDSLNYIKGFRYELHCISKAAGERHGVLWVLNRRSQVQAWNEQRSDKYSTKLLQELIQRYEPPDDRNRWDKPLYTINVTPDKSDESKMETVQQSVYNMHALSDSLAGTTEEIVVKKQQQGEIQNQPAKKSAFSRAKKVTSTPVTSSSPQTNGSSSSTSQPISTVTLTSPVSSLTTNITMNANLDQNAQTQPQQSLQTKSLEEQLDDILNSFLSVQPLKEGYSTRQHIAGNANALQDIDSITQRLMFSIASAQNSATGGKLQVQHQGTVLNMNCHRPVSLPELRRLRKQYMQWVANHLPEDSTEIGIATSFIAYVQDQV